MNVDKLMRKDIAPLRPADLIATGWRAMRDQRLSGLPAADADGDLVGMLTEADLIVRLASAADAAAGGRSSSTTSSSGWPTTIARLSGSPSGT